ncbi:MAG TPA: hypothetical protein VMV97_06445 [Sulfuriferula sp.]|nr:hypothetical protein [Sulfuriferula sp.]
MAEESKSLGAVAAILAALPSEVKGILSFMLLFVAFFAMMSTLLNMPTFFKNLVASSGPKELCWELKEVQGIAFKFNKCTGEAIQVEVKTVTPAPGGNKL